MIEYLNETVFITSDDWANEARIEIVDACDVTGLALLTDGLQLLGFDHRRFSVRYRGLDQRLTGVEPARVVTELLA